MTSLAQTTATEREAEATGDPFPRLGGALCLDFVNTLYWRGDPARRDDRLSDYAALVAWSVHAAGVSQGAAAALLAEAARRPQAAREVLDRARRLREAILVTCTTAGRGDAASGDGHATLGVAALVLNEEVAIASARRRLSPPDAAALQAGEWQWQWMWDPEPAALDRPLWAVADSAATLLAAGAHVHVRSCANDACGWVFLDLTRNHSRRWCDMRLCGNRAKVRRHAQRHRRLAT